MVLINNDYLGKCKVPRDPALKRVGVRLHRRWLRQLRVRGSGAPCGSGAQHSFGRGRWPFTFSTSELVKQNLISRVTNFVAVFVHDIGDSWNGALLHGLPI